MRTNALFIALLWRTVAAYLVLALALLICLVGLFALGVNVPPRELAASVTFIKLKPTFAYMAFASVLLASEFGFEANIVRLIAGKRLGISLPIWRRYLIELSLLLFALAILNVFVAFTASVEIWINYKLFGALTLLLAGIYVLANRTSKLVENSL